MSNAFQGSNIFLLFVYRRPLLLVNGRNMWSFVWCILMETLYDLNNEHVLVCSLGETGAVIYYNIDNYWINKSF